jgi:hypothetical protein
MVLVQRIPVHELPKTSPDDCGLLLMPSAHIHGGVVPKSPRTEAGIQTVKEPSPLGSCPPDNRWAVNVRGRLCQPGWFKQSWGIR